MPDTLDAPHDSTCPPSAANVPSRSRRLLKHAAGHLRTPDWQSPALSRWQRHTPARRALLIPLAVLAAIALFVPLLFLTSWINGTPGALRDDPAVHALQLYEAALDGNPRHVKALDAVRDTLTIDRRRDGSVRVSRLSNGHCFYLVVPASAAANDSGVKIAPARDCRRRQH